MGIAIMTSGGDCAGMNPGIKRFVEYSIEKGLTPYLIYDGLEGMIDDHIIPATHANVAGIIYKGGTILRSSRSKRFFEPKYRQQAYDNLKARGIDQLVVLGGDGSFRALDVFYREFGIPFAGVPATIDNDIFGTDYCLGVDTALNVIRKATDEIRDTASSSKRAFVIETMGRDCGYLALISALTSGAEICLIPELDYDLDSLKERFRREVAAGRHYMLAIVAEGVKIAPQLTQWLEQEVGIEARLTVLGHTQRGGSPTVLDRLRAFEFVTVAIDALLADCQDNVVFYQNCQMSTRPITEVVGRKSTISPLYLNAGRKLTR